MQSVYRLGKIKSKYLILIVLGFAEYRDQAGSILFDASRSLRKLIKTEIKTSLQSYTEAEVECYELPTIELRQEKRYFKIPNIFYEGIFENTLCINFSSWRFIKGLWKDTYRVKTLIIDFR